MRGALLSPPAYRPEREVPGQRSQHREGRRKPNRAWRPHQVEAESGVQGGQVPRICGANPEGKAAQRTHAEV